MESSSEDLTNYRPPPPPNLSKENVGIWVGWNCKGNREVAREAAAKGIPVDLVVQFLSQRKQIRLEEAENYFRDEVFIWAKELLDRKQIFRVSHILTNIGVDPQEELTKVFCTTTNFDLREYIGNHLKNQKKLDENLQQLWHFLNVILKNNLLISKWKLSEDSIECLNSQETDWKCEISSKLFLRTFDILLLPFITGEALWKQLLAYNDTKLMKFWINIYYKEAMGNYDISENLLQVFKTFPINIEMIDQLNSSETSANTCNMILNDLSRFGVFCNKDRENFLTILWRLYQSNNIQNTFQIIKKHTSNITEKDFLNLMVNYCVKNKLYVVFSSCVENFNIFEDSISGNRHLDLILDFRQLAQNFTEENLKNNILKVSLFLGENIEEYLKENTIILLSLITFSNEVDIEKVLKQNFFKIQDITLTKCLENLPKQLKSFNDLMLRSLLINNFKLTYYSLLEKHYKINIKKMYSFRFEGNPVPDFNNKNLIKKFGYLKKINYLFYIKQYRPSIACKLFLLDQYEIYKSFPQENVHNLQKKIYKIVMHDFMSIEIVSSCTAFLEMIGIKSDYLKIAVKCAKILLESGLHMDEIIKMFINVENSPNTILSLLEPIVIKQIEFDRFSEGSYFIEAIKLYEIVINFTIYYELKLPEMFLRSCATNNMWIPFLIFAQIKNYPTEQIKPLLQSFKNPNLLEHVYHSVLHDIQIDDQNVLMRERDSRNYFLSRIGVRKTLENFNGNESIYSMTSQSSYGSNSSSGGSDFLEIDISNTKTTLLQTLIRCHNSTDPPRALLQACQLYKNPLLAIFATSYEPDSVITNWLTWLAVSCGIYEVFTNFESVALNANSVTYLLNNCMKNRFPRTILQSLEIFLPKNSLQYFIEFLNLCIDRIYDFSLLSSKLEAFRLSMAKCRRYSVLTENDHEMTYLTNKVWIKTTALQLLSSTIQYNVNSFYEQIQMVDYFCKINVMNYIDCPDLNNLLKILQIIYDSNAEIRFNVSLYFDEKNGYKAVADCLNILLDNYMFEHAIKIAKIESLSLDEILLKKWKYNYQSADSNTVDFLTKCNEEFKNYLITPEVVIGFYLEHSRLVTNSLEKYRLLKLAHQWAKTHNLSTKYDLEKEMWLSFLYLEEKYRVTENMVLEEPTHLLYKEMIDLLAYIPKYDGELSPEANNLLKDMLNNSLNNNNIWLALKLEKMFKCSDTNLDILKLCYNLAEGLLMPYQLNTEQRLIVTNGTNFRRFSHRRTFLSARLSGLSSSASPSPMSTSYLQQADTLDAPVQDTLAILCNLAEKVTSGEEMAQNVFMMYRISFNIEIPYQLIISNTDPMKMLKDALEDDCSNKLEVVHDFFSVYKWNKDQMSDFVCEEIINCATKYIKTKADQFMMWDLKMDQDFHLVLKLLQENCSLLGYKIYSYASAMHKSQVLADLDFKINELALVIELIIISHECFTADCNMEGISIILKKCQEIISHLLVLRSWKLIVRLLTGVGRYTEMNYVFQILRENDQFEFLLRKGSRRDNGLKTALLEYLKKYCPDNRELYKIVALHFTLFSEVAMLWEREAQSIIKNLIAIAKLEMQNNKLNPDTEPFILFSNVDGTKICLNKALENFIHATEFHLQGEKLAKAMHSAKQAELIALQLSLLQGLPINSTAICLLHLHQNQINNIIANHLNFDQTLILVQAYNYQPDWSYVLFEQCIIKNDQQYLQSFLKHRSLTESLVNDISRKFLVANIVTPRETNSMKAILNNVLSVHIKYRVGSELGFSDIVEDLISSGQLAYLKDTVWKKGYKG